MFERYYKAKRQSKRIKKVPFSTLDSHKVVDNITLNTIFTGTYNDCCTFQRAFGQCQVCYNI